MQLPARSVLSGEINQRIQTMITEGAKGGRALHKSRLHPKTPILATKNQFNASLDAGLLGVLL